MHVPYSIAEVPHAASPPEAEELLYEFATTPLPVVAIHNTGSTLEESTENIRPYVPDGISLREETMVYEFGASRPMTDTLGLHLDYLPSPPGLETVKITHHFNISGLVQGSFFRLGSEWRRVWGPKAGPQFLARLVDLLRHGYTDPDVLQPPCYRTISRAGTRIIFKNGYPLAHDFTRLSRIRESDSYDSLMRVHPGMEILTDPNADPSQFYTGPYTG